MNQWVKLSIVLSVAFPILFALALPIAFINYYKLIIKHTIPLFVFSIVLVGFNFYSLKIFYEFANGEAKKILVTIVILLCNLVLLGFWFWLLFLKGFAEGFSGILK